MARARRDDPNGPQGRRNQTMRDLRGHIHRLEVENELQRDKLRAAEEALDVVSTPPSEALRAVCSISVASAVKIGGVPLAKELGELAQWAHDLDLANGKYCSTYTKVVPR